MENLKTKAISNSLWKFAERFFAQGISFIVSLVIARILVPSDYSIVSVITIFFNFANVIITGGLNTALIQKKNADSKDYSSVLILSVAVSVFIYCILFVLAPYISILFNMTELTIYFRVMTLILPVTALKSVWCAYISSSLQFKKYFWATFGGTIFSGVLGVYLALNGFGAWALVWQQMSNTIIDTLILILSTHIGFTFQLSLTRIKSLLSYGWKILLSSLISVIYSETMPLIVGLKFTKSDLSFYDKGKSFPSLLSSATTSTLSAVLFPVLAKEQDDKSKILKHTRVFMRVSSFVIFPIMIGLFAIADTFVLAALTEKWMPAVFYIRVFCICSMFDIIAVGNCETIKAIGRSEIFLLMEIIKKSCYFIIIAVFIFVSPTPKVFTMASLMCLVVQIVVNSIPNKKLIGYRFCDQMKDLSTNFILSAIMGLLVYLEGCILPVNVWLKLLIQVVTGASFYFLINKVFKSSVLDYLMTTAKHFIIKKGK